MIYRINASALPNVLSVGRIRYRHGWSSSYEHRVNVLIFVISGEFLYEFNDGHAVTVGAGTHLLIPDTASYRVTASDDCDFYYAHFLLPVPMTAVSEEEAVKYLTERSAEQLDALNKTYYGPEFNDLYIFESMEEGDRVESVRYRFSRCEEFRFGSNPLDRMRLRNSFFNMIITLGSTTARKLLALPKSSSTLAKLTGYIEENYTVPLTLDDLSREFGLSKQYIMRLFHSQLNTTVSKYVNTVKLRKALDLLRFTGLSIGEVAYSLGYSSSFYFCRIFKQTYHLTPTEYQRSQAAGKSNE